MLFFVFWRILKKTEITIFYNIAVFSLYDWSAGLERVPLYSKVQLWYPSGFLFRYCSCIKGFSGALKIHQLICSFFTTRQSPPAASTSTQRSGEGRMQEQNKWVSGKRNSRCEKVFEKKFDHHVSKKYTWHCKHLV